MFIIFINSSHRELGSPVMKFADFDTSIGPIV